jgi:hypothetical protein
MDLHHGLAFAGFLVPDTDPVHPRVRHKIPPLLSRSCGSLND